MAYGRIFLIGVTVSFSVVTTVFDRAMAEFNPNAKITPFVGTVNDHFTAGVNGSFSLPLNKGVGVQINGTTASPDQDSYRFIGGHLFWRKPTVGTFGGFGGYSHTNGENDSDSVYFGLEGERYYKKLTLSGQIGYGVHDAYADEGFGSVEASYYPSENLQLSLGYRYYDGSKAVTSAEYQLLNTNTFGAAFFTDGFYSTDQDYNVLTGFRIYFGGEKPLIQRHREDDPYGLGVSGVSMMR